MTRAADFNRRSAQLKALGHPVRLRIVAGLLRERCNVGHIVAGLRLPQSTVSQHLGVLRAAGVIVPQRQGVRTCYRVADPAIARCVARLLD